MFVTLAAVCQSCLSALALIMLSATNVPQPLTVIPDMGAWSAFVGSRVRGVVAATGFKLGPVATIALASSASGAGSWWFSYLEDNELDFCYLYSDLRRCDAAEPEPEIQPVPEGKPPAATENNQRPKGKKDFLGADWSEVSVLDNDIDSDGDSIWARVQPASLPDVGTLTLSADGYITFLADDPDFSGYLTFHYKPMDQGGAGNRTRAIFPYGDVEIMNPAPSRGDEESGKARNSKQNPEPVVTYQPKFPVLGQYSVEGVCESIPAGAAIVTLRDGETLDNAYTRLLLESGKMGGTIQVPWNVDTVQCDSLSLSKDRIMKGKPFTLKGIPGPEGQQPRFYCRSKKRDGTIPKKNPFFLQFGLARKKSEAPNHNALIENLHIDGYRSAIFAPNSGNLVARNNYIHHTYGDGVLNNGVSEGKKGFGAELEFCGNELSHVGLGNYKHGMYMHKSVVDESPINVTLVDNYLHSCNGSSCYKSVANTNTLINNRIFNTADTDPTYTKKYSGMVIDVMACAQNRIEGNELYRLLPVDIRLPGGAIIGIRNRKSAFGCNVPPGYVELSPQNVVPLMDSTFWTKAYWDDLDGRKIFKTIIKGNSFTHEGKREGSKVAITDWGTYPNHRATAFGPACLLTPPEWWYERHRTYLINNTFDGFADVPYSQSGPSHAEDRCGRPAPEVDMRDYDLIEVSTDESI